MTKWNLVLATRTAPELCHAIPEIRHCEELSDEAIQRGTTHQLRCPTKPRYRTGLLRCARNDEGKKETNKRKQNADRRVILPSASCDAARALCLFSSPTCGKGWEGARSPVGVPPRRLLRRPNATAQLQIRASWDLVGAHDPKGSNNRVRKTLRFSAGVTRSFLSQSSELLADRSSCRPGVYPRSRPGAEVTSRRPREPLSLRQPASPAGVLYVSEICSV
jgi:hypothetical protein